MEKVAGEEEVGAANEALGSLFKLTQIHLWADGSIDTPLEMQISPSKSTRNLSGIANIRSKEMNLIKEMNSMGLPVSFRTNKEWKNRTRGYQKEGIKDLSEEVNVASTMNLASDDAEVDIPCLEIGCAPRTIVEEENCEPFVGSCCLGNEDRDSLVTSEATESHDSNDWKVYWDSYYGRSYFYSTKTQESTWEPPLGMEHLAYSNESHNLNELVEETIEKPHSDLIRIVPADDAPTKDSDHLGRLYQRPCEIEVLEEASSLIDNCQEAFIGNQSLDITTRGEEGNCASVVNSVKKAKKGSRRNRAKKKLLNLYTGTQTEDGEEYSAIHAKYWCQRYFLFSRFDEGIKMDEEGWFSVTPEPIAKHHATRCNGGIVIDCFTGVGGNAIQFALRNHYVIAIDIDPKRLDLAQHNAAIYGVADKIDFVTGDFFDLAHNLKGSTVFLSPPWGGPDYLKASMYDMKTMLRPRDGDALFKAAMNIASTIIMFLPRNVDINQLAELALSTSPPWSLEVEKNYLNGKLKAITAYFFREHGF